VLDTFPIDVVVGRTTVPVNVGEAVCANVPDVGKVTEVLPDVTKATVCVLEPMVVLPLTVIVFPVLATPVPPYCPAMTEPFQVPVVIVPIETRLDKVVTALFTSVPLVGKVTFVAPDKVRVRACAPEVVRFPQE
jgi:hypothetical protein